MSREARNLSSSLRWKQIRRSASPQWWRRSLISSQEQVVGCSDLLAVSVPPGWNVAERSDLPGDLRLLGRAAAPGPGHPGPGPLLGLYESQPAPAELLLEVLDQPSSGPAAGRRGGGCGEQPWDIY